MTATVAPARPSRAGSARRVELAGLALFVALATLARVATIDRAGLWADETFSLAMATGHSLEHPAAVAEPARGDYVEAPGPLTAADYRRYLEPDGAGPDPGRVLRAVRLSDTSPPLYYLLLQAWTLALGTGDGALRLLSVVCGLLCLPLVWLLGGEVGGRPARSAGVVLFSLAPAGLFYSTEGRMYALLWLEVLGLTWLTLWVARGRRWAGPPWTLVGAAGLLTHYFFAPICLVCVCWLLWRPGRAGRGSIALVALAAVLLALPWYAWIADSLGAWRVTRDWLFMPPAVGRLQTLLRWPLGYFDVNGPWSTVPGGTPITMLAVLALGASLGLRLRGRLPRPRRLLLVAMVAAALLVPLALDVLRGSYLTAVSRYALAGYPAAVLLLGLALGRLRRLPHLLALVAIAAAWLPADLRILDRRISEVRAREVAATVAADARPGDLVLLHGIPSGLLTIARYLPPETPMASWVGQLGQRRVPDDLLRLAGGARRIVLIAFHEVGEPMPQEAWLREHAELEREQTIGAARLLIFHPYRAETFPHEAAGLSR